MRAYTLACTAVIAVACSSAVWAQAITDSPCEEGHPEGCYVTTHTDRTTRTIYFFDTYQNGSPACGVRLTNRGSNGDWSFTLGLQKRNNLWTTFYNGVGDEDDFQQYTFLFSEYGNRLDWEIVNFEDGEARNEVRSVFRRSSEDACFN